MVSAAQVYEIVFLFFSQFLNMKKKKYFESKGSLRYWGNIEIGWKIAESQLFCDIRDTLLSTSWLVPRLISSLERVFPRWRKKARGKVEKEGILKSIKADNHLSRTLFQSQRPLLSCRKHHGQSMLPNLQSRERWKFRIWWWHWGTLLLWATNEFFSPYHDIWEGELLVTIRNECLCD